MPSLVSLSVEFEANNGYQSLRCKQFCFCVMVCTALQEDKYLCWHSCQWIFRAHRKRWIAQNALSCILKPKIIKSLEIINAQCFFFSCCQSCRSSFSLTPRHTLPYWVLNESMISCRCALLHFVRHLMIAFSSVPATTGQKKLHKLWVRINQLLVCNLSAV